MKSKPQKITLMVALLMAFNSATLFARMQPKQHFWNPLAQGLVSNLDDNYQELVDTINRFRIIINASDDKNEAMMLGITTQKLLQFQLTVYYEAQLLTMLFYLEDKAIVKFCNIRKTLLTSIVKNKGQFESVAQFYLPEIKNEVALHTFDKARKAAKQSEELFSQTLQFYKMVVNSLQRAKK
jgi:hypothetical protein